MTARFGRAREADLLADYLASLPTSRVRVEKRQIKNACAEFTGFRPGESVLDHVNSTLWIPAWSAHVASRWRLKARAERLQALQRWWGWLFDHNILDDNVLECFAWKIPLLRGEGQCLLTRNLQRPIAEFMRVRGPERLNSQRMVLSSLRSFNVFLNRVGPGEPHLVRSIDEQLIRAWIRHLAIGATPYRLSLIVGDARRFLDFLVDTGRLAVNPVSTMSLSAGWTSNMKLVAGLLGQVVPTSPQPAPAPRFVSCLAPHLETFLALKRAMGRRYEGAEDDLRRFDRFAATRVIAHAIVTPDLAYEWLKSISHVHPVTRRHRARVIRQFCVYLARLDVGSYVPDRTFGAVQVPLFKPHIYTAAEFQALLRAALRMPASRTKLRPLTLYTVLLLLYSTGLRIGEALRLRLSDIDHEAQTLLVRQTKFFKTRLVPFSTGLAEKIRDYIDARRLHAPVDPASHVFLNCRRNPYSPDNFAREFHQLLRTANVPHVVRARRPRVHDIRHTFAVTRVVRWYREGADVQAKLPLLSTYMGHVDILSTQLYLTATAELLCEANQRFANVYGSLISDRQEGSQ